MKTNLQLNTAALPPGWELSEPFMDSASIAGEPFFLFGLEAHNTQGVSITGSAAQYSKFFPDAVAADCQKRATYELFERIAIVEAESLAASPQQEIVATTIDRQQSVLVERSDVFPRSPEPEAWQYSKSSGVAAHVSWNHACVGAMHELIERDVVLRSWFGGIPPVRVEIAKTMIPMGLLDIYDFQGYKFIDPWTTTAVVTGVFAFPRIKSAELPCPMVYGFAAKSGLAESFKSSLGECLQRLAFLYGEEIADTEPTMKPTPDYHQEVYLRHASEQHLKAWLSGMHQRQEGNIVPNTPTPQVSFVNITPSGYPGDMVVVKAVSRPRLKLTFGMCRDYMNVGWPEHLYIHPIV